MIKSWSQFIREFVESESFIDAKMQELKDLINSATEGQNIIYQWENKNDKHLVVTFTIGELSIKYDFDIDDLHLSKTAGDRIDFESTVDSIDEGLEIIEKDVHSILGISESYTGQWESSISEDEAEEVIQKIIKFLGIEAVENMENPEGLVEELEECLRMFDKETITVVIDTILFGEDSQSWKEWCKDQIISVGDKIMNKYGTEPMQVLNAYETAFNYLRRQFDWEEEIVEERVKAQRYKGRKIPGKYLTKNPGKMKKEIDTFRGKKEYKKDWDADYTSGKGGVGKRVKTKKSAATKAYQRMFGNKEK